MDAKHLIELHEALNDESTALLERKNSEYAGIGGDALSNFKRIAEELDITPQQAWAVHFYKQTSAVLAHVRGNRKITDSLRSRILDIRNYTTFMIALDAAEGRRRGWLCDDSPFYVPVLDPDSDPDSDILSCPRCGSEYVTIHLNTNKEHIFKCSSCDTERVLSKETP